LGHTIISKEVFDGITRDCDFSKERQTRNCMVNPSYFIFFKATALSRGKQSEKFAGTTRIKFDH